MHLQLHLSVKLLPNFIILTNVKVLNFDGHFISSLATPSGDAPNIGSELLMKIPRLSIFWHSILETMVRT